MIVLLDSTVLVADPLLRSTAWKILAHASRRWGVRVCVTEVVQLEAVAGYKRRMAEASLGFERWEAKHAGPLGLHAMAAEARERLEADVRSYSERLKSAFDGVPVEVVPIPDIDHRTLVERATERVPPCDRQGNGYRDTLNWLTLISLAKEHEGLLIWVSGDSGDFRASDGISLHPHLDVELGDAGLSGRVELAASLRDASVRIASDLADATEGGLKDLQTRLSQETLMNFLRTELLSDPPTIEVDRVSLALPMSVRSANISELDEAGDSTFSVTAPLDGEEAAVEVSLVCETTILAEWSADKYLGADFLRIAEEDGLCLGQVRKPLRFTAFITVDKYDRPTGGELTSVRALDDDPGHAAWRTAALRKFQDFQLPPDTIAALRKFQDFQLPPDTIAALRKFQDIQLPPDTIAALRKFQNDAQRFGGTTAGRHEDATEEQAFEDGSGGGEPDTEEENGDAAR